MIEELFIYNNSLSFIYCEKIDFLLANANNKLYN